jgi:hypothetical protein
MLFLNGLRFMDVGVQRFKGSGISGSEVGGSKVQEPLNL